MAGTLISARPWRRRRRSTARPSRRRCSKPSPRTEGPGPPDSPELQAAIKEELVRREILAQEARKKASTRRAKSPAKSNSPSRPCSSAPSLPTTSSPIRFPKTSSRRITRRSRANLGSTEYKPRHVPGREGRRRQGDHRQARQGRKFSDLAKQSKDPGSKDNGGELGLEFPEQLREALRRGAGQAKKGEYTKAPVKTDFGYHVILLDDSRALTPPPTTRSSRNCSSGPTPRRSRTHQELRAKAKGQLTVPADRATIPARTWWGFFFPGVRKWYSVWASCSAKRRGGTAREPPRRRRPQRRPTTGFRLHPPRRRIRPGPQAGRPPFRLQHLDAGLGDAPPSARSSSTTPAAGALRQFRRLGQQPAFLPWAANPSTTRSSTPSRLPTPFFFFSFAGDHRPHPSGRPPGRPSTSAVSRSASSASPSTRPLDRPDLCRIRRHRRRPKPGGNIRDYSVALRSDEVRHPVVLLATNIEASTTTGSATSGTSKFPRPFASRGEGTAARSPRRPPQAASPALFNLVQSDAETAEVADAMKQDPMLTFRILRYL